ncbi:MAG: VOC family protein [Chloroflexota bacterium]
MPRPVHFEINAKDPERAVKFYQQVFDWKINKWDGPQDYWLVQTGETGEPGIDGAIMRFDREWMTVNTVGVSSYDEATQRVVAAGGKVLTPRTEIPGVGIMSYCADPEGNVFGVLQPTGEM